MPEMTESELYRHVVMDAQDAIIYADREGTIRLWNAGAEVIFERTAEEAVGQSLDLIIPDRLRPRHWEGWQRVMETGETKYGRELLAVPGQRADGTRISLEFSISIMHDEGGAIAGIAAILRDVSERFERDRALHKRVAELEAQLRPAGVAGEGAASNP